MPELRKYGRKTVAFWAFIVVAVLAAGVMALLLQSRNPPVENGGSAYVPREELKAPVNVAVIGDSYTTGTDFGGTKPDINWVNRVATSSYAVGYPLSTSTDPYQETGYVHREGSGPIFRDQIRLTVKPDTDIVVVFGSRWDKNEPVAAVRAAAQDLFLRVRATAPDAELVVIGPVTLSAPAPANLTGVRDALAGEANAAHATFIDPIAEGWFLGDKAYLIGADGEHPSDQGHAYLSELIYPKLAPIIEASRKTQ